MRGLSALLLVLLSVGCSSGRIKLVKESGVKKKAMVSHVPFVSQLDRFCGPASLAMVLGHLGKEVNQTELSAITYTPGREGTLQTDLISAIRRKGLLALPVSGMEQLLRELDYGHPILVLQNLGLDWYPKWHYAVVIGYDLEEDDLFLHSGKSSNLKTEIRTFEKTWKRSNNWGLFVVEPGFIPLTAKEEDMVKAAGGLELGGHFKEAKRTFEKILERWPQSFGALVGLGNTYFALKDLANSSKYLKAATEKNPKSKGAWHNYSVVLRALKRFKEAKRAAEKSQNL